jgi:hypothetical protein
MTMFAFDAGQDWGFIERYMGAMLFVAPATFVAVLWALVLTTKGEFLRVTFGDVSESERKRVRRALEKYCGQDTEGMIWILDALMAVTQNR